MSIGSLHSAPLLIASNQSLSNHQRAIFITLVVILALVFIVILAAAIVHKLINRHDDSHDAFTGGFTLAQLRDLHRSGQISDEEFESAKALVIGRSRQILDEAEGSAKSDEEDFPFPLDDDDENEAPPGGEDESQDPPGDGSDNDAPRR